jgi:menaquinol-cytochrome c reductase iron-sulfur subunit
VHAWRGLLGVQKDEAMTNRHGMQEETGLSTPVGTRRGLFQWITAAAMSFIGVGLGIPLVGYVISPAFKRREQSWVALGKVNDVPVHEPTQLTYVASLRDGYMETTVQKAVWAVKKDNGEVTAFSPQCTHLGCGYRWSDSERTFQCPCHASVFDLHGAVLSGPAPRPLDHLPVKVDNGVLYVIYKEFKAGLPTAVEL